MIKIDFGNKFTDIHLDEIVEKYWDLAFNAESNEEIRFMLDKLEWIALEEKTFLFAWFRFLILNNKKIKIFLPKYNSGFKASNQLVNLWGKWKIYSFLSLVDGTPIIDDYFDVDNQVNKIVDNETIIKNIENEQDDITIVPFQPIASSGYGEITSIDDLVKHKIHKPLDLAKKIYAVLETHTPISSNENILLSKIVSNELFLNVIHHSFQENEDEFNECYFAISLKRELSYKRTYQSELNKRIWERTSRGEYYWDAKTKVKEPDKAEIEKRLDYYLKNTIPNGYKSERSKECLDFFKTQNDNIYPYRNDSFIEFTFLDFGKGIPKSLKNNYEESISNAKNNLILTELNSDHLNKNLHTRILEYAFLLNSSRHPFDLEYQTDYEIPRGLYFLIDIVRRYNGLVIARSGKGKVIYNFKNDVEEIKDAVVYSQNDASLPFFQGTMISIVIPALQKFSEKSGATKPSYKIPDKITLKKNFYYSLIDIVKNIENEYLRHNPHKPNLQFIYRKLFDSINEIFTKHKTTPSLIVFDCTGFKVFPLKHKLLYYFCTSPNINELTSAVLLNFNDVDIINDVKNSIAFKLNNPDENNHLYKPIPIINSETEIHWLGVANELDEAKLNELLKYESYNVSQTDLSQAKEYKGNFFNIDKYGNVTSNILTQSEIIEFVKNGK